MLPSGLGFIFLLRRGDGFLGFFVCDAVAVLVLGFCCADIRVLFSSRASAFAPSRRRRCLSVFLRGHPHGAFAAQALPFGFFFAGIRVAPSRRRRCPCAGRHLLLFAAAKKSRQKKAAHTEPLDLCPRAPNGPVLHAATYFSMCVAIALNNRRTHFMHLRSGAQRRATEAAQVANCV
jgi:hypothetical protein